MAKMAESNDFRPFKFRIQAFTNAFLDTVCAHIILYPLLHSSETILKLAQHRMSEDVIAQKKVRIILQCSICEPRRSFG
jgi:hypothetical protein